MFTKTLLKTIHCYLTKIVHWLVNSELRTTVAFEQVLFNGPIRHTLPTDCRMSVSTNMETLVTSGSFLVSFSLYE